MNENQGIEVSGDRQTTREENGKSKLDWLRTIEFKDLLTGDLAMVYEWCGQDVLIALLDNFLSMTLYVSRRPLELARRRFIRKYAREKSVREICHLLGCSERFYYEALAENNRLQGQEELFAISAGEKETP